MADHNQSEVPVMTAEEKGDLSHVLNEVLEILFEEAKERITARSSKLGSRISFTDRMKIDLANKVLKLTERYNAEARFDKFVDATNTIIPTLTKLFGEEALINKLPPKLKDDRVVELCDKAGATELHSLILKARGDAPAVPANG